MAQRLGYDRAMLAEVAEVAGALARAVMHHMRWAVKERHGLGSVDPLHAGVFMVVQRFRSDLGLFVHLHTLVTDGAFDEHGGEVCFLPAATPMPERLTAVLAQVHKALATVAEDDDLKAPWRTGPPTPTCRRTGSSPACAPSCRHRMLKRRGAVSAGPTCSLECSPST